MQVSVTTTQGLARRLEVAVPGDRVAGEVDQRLKQLARTVRLKGFRPGKVPYAVVKQQYGSQVRAEAVADLMRSTFAEAVSQEKLRPAGGPQLTPLADDPAELRYAAEFEVLPEVAIKPLDTISIERPVASVTDADIDAMLERMRSQRPVFKAVQRPAAEGDRVTIDYVGRIDGSAFPGGSGDGQRVQLGAHQLLPEIEQGLVGMTAGERRVVQARFPDDYGAAAVAGREAEFELTVQQVEERSLPPLDEAFARSLGVADGQLSSLREDVRKSMEHELAEAVQEKQREQLLEALYRDNPLELPRSMVEDQVAELQAQAMRRMRTEDPSHLPARELFEANARRRVALGLLLGEIVRTQNITADHEKVHHRLEALAAGSENPQETERQLHANREVMRQLESATLEDQAVAFLLSQVKIRERPSSFRELTGFAAEPGAAAPGAAA